MKDAPSLDVAAAIDESAFGTYQLRVAFLCGAVAMADEFDVQAIGFVAPLIAKDFATPVASFGPVFGASLFGLTLGALVFGLLADRYGRRKIILLCTALFGVFALSTAWATSIPELIVLRFLTGIGLGGVTPNVITLTAEYSPSRLRATLVSTMFCGFPLGAIVGGFLSSHLAPVYGWKATFYMGGLFPILLVPLLAALLPESIRFLASTGRHQAETLRILKQLNPAMNVGPGTQLIVKEDGKKGSPVFNLFKDGRGISTALLWVIFFMNLLVLYFLSNWLPSVLRKVGLPIEMAIVATTLLYLGGIAGGVVLARLLDRSDPHIVLGLTYFFAALAVALLGSAGTDIRYIMVLIFCAGFTIIGAQLSINAMASEIYPTALRSTGVGWALGIGRVGSIVGPVVGGILMSANLDMPSLFFLTAVPALIAGSCVFLLRFVMKALPQSSPQHQVK